MMAARVLSFTPRSLSTKLAAIIATNSIQDHGLMRVGTPMCGFNHTAPCAVKCAGTLADKVAGHPVGRHGFNEVASVFVRRDDNRKGYEWTKIFVRHMDDLAGPLLQGS